MARDVVDSEVVESRDALVAWLEAGCKPAGPFRIGAEHEKIPFYRANHSPVPYGGDKGIRALLEGMRKRLSWDGIEDGGNLIGLYDPNGGGAISLEPGGQFELSGAPLDDAHATADELDRHLTVARSVAEPLGIGFLALGMSPKWSLAETPIMPKHRYAIMARYMPKVGTRGLDMMFRTATVQVNLDFMSEKDMVAKMRVGLALQPAITALFANSPFTDRKLNGLLSARSEIWRHTDAARTGMLSFVFEPGMGFERYVDYALDVPLYFLKRGGNYQDVAGASFRDLLAGRLKEAPGERATIADWANHLSTIFPEVRLKRYLEMRGADVGPPERIVALAALMAGLYYNPEALGSAEALIEGWSAEDRQKLRDDAPLLGLAAEVRGRDLRSVALDMLAISRSGLKRRARLNARGEDETILLHPLEAIADSGREPARRWIQRYEGPWGRSVDPSFDEAAF
ncbi:glutamate--cysteine ligase [Roseiarcus sp.]|uniref:glutamate--cysteine ligase n=1 Tax=Roseiarcus sp. TaxID=1969460 RepID=UPI003D1240A9